MDKKKLKKKKLLKKKKHLKKFKPTKIYKKFTYRKKQNAKRKAYEIITVIGGLTVAVCSVLALPFAIAGLTNATLIALAVGAFSFTTTKLSRAFLRASINIARKKREKEVADILSKKYEISDYKSETKDNKNIVIQDGLEQFTILPNLPKHETKKDFEK